MSPKRSIVAAVGALALVAVLLSGGGNGPDDDHVEVVAVFSDASPLLPGNVVKAAGVDVGTVESIEVEDGRAHVSMIIEKAALPLHEDVTATITTQDLLGERFVRLDQGSAEKPALGEPMIIPEAQTSRVVDLQDVLNSVDTPTAAGLSALLTESGEALRGHGKDAGLALAALGPAMNQADDLAAVLRDQNILLGRLVDSAEPVASALGTKDGKSLDELVASATQLLERLASERGALQASLNELPATLTSARATLAEVAGVADPTTRTLRALRPVTSDLNEIGKELKRFADAADPALASLPSVLKEAERLLDNAAPVVAALRPGGKALPATANAAERLSDVALSGQSLTDLMEFAKGWSLATSDYDAISHYFKAMVPLSPNALGDTAAGLLPALPDGILHDLPVPTAPDLGLPGREEEGAAAPADSSVVGNLLNGLPGGPRSQSATGLTAQQEQNLIEQILGGLK